MTDAPLPEPLADVQREAARLLLDTVPELADLGRLYTSSGHEIAVVGGSVRDALLGHVDPSDVDLTTDASPEVSAELLSGWADSVWEIGARFGTIGAQRDGRVWEVTTYRTDVYDGETRKPEVSFGTSLAEDLVRRDFSVNAMAVKLPDLEFVDLHSGTIDLAARRLRTPGRPEDSFRDDPLRMLRAARFVARLELTIEPHTYDAIIRMADRLTIISAERIRDELSKLLCAPDPRRGLEVLVDSGMAEIVIPELPALRLEIDEHHRHKDVYQHTLMVLEQAMALEEGEADLILRLAALLHDIGKPRTRRFESGGGVSFHHHEVVGARMTAKRMRALRYSKDEIEAVARLVELHLRFHGYGTGEWTDSAVRRYVRDAGELLPRLHKLTRADCTTRNRRRAAALQQAYDSLERRIAELAAAEELNAVRPELDGNEIMAILGVPPGPEVGAAYRFLLDLRLDSGPLGKEAVEAELRAWWQRRQES